MAWGPGISEVLAKTRRGCLAGRVSLFVTDVGGLFDLGQRTRRNSIPYIGRELKMERLTPLPCSQVSLEALGQA